MSGEYIPVPVDAAKRIAVDFQKDVVVIIAVDAAHNETHCTTYAPHPANKTFAADLGEKLMAGTGHELAAGRFFEDFRDPEKIPSWPDRGAWLAAQLRALAAIAKGWGSDVWAEQLTSLERRVEP